MLDVLGPTFFSDYIAPLGVFLECGVYHTILMLMMRRFICHLPQVKAYESDESEAYNKLIPCIAEVPFYTTVEIQNVLQCNVHVC